MTIGMAWIGERPDGRERLYLASDSRITGGYTLDACPKILTLPRSDCALCFAGDIAATYPLMIQMSYAIAAHQPARERSLDVSRVKDHLLRVCTDFIGRIEGSAFSWGRSDIQFLFGGYSWQAKDFRLWTIYYMEKAQAFAAREAVSFHPYMRKAAFIGDQAKPVRSRLFKELASLTHPADLEPLKVLAESILDAEQSSTIGGPPQVVRIAQHMNTRTLCVRWKGVDTLFGRQLFDYENTDYWSVDPLTGKLEQPRKFGRRSE
jgi:hypothetical protein